MSHIDKILVVACSPAKGWEGHTPLVGLDPAGQMCRSGKRWLEWCEVLGLDWQECEYRNIFDAEGELEEWLDGFKWRGLVIALGSQASARVRRQPVVISLPHPSGRNRQLNDAEAVRLRLEAARASIDRWREVVSYGLHG